MKGLKIRAFILIMLVFLSVLGWSQNAEETFGKNRIQYREFDWKYITSENFEVYYYGEGINFAKESALFLEDNFDRITDLMGYPPYSRTKIFLYNSVTELQQSNVGINYQGAISGGETQFIKANIEIAHPGTLEGFKEELLYKVTKLLLNEMLYGGSLKDMLQNTFMNLPEWLVEGAALYISKGWTVEMDDYIRGELRNEGNIKLQKLTGDKAALAGQSIWNYISERHGKSNISSILNYIKIIRNEEKSIAITLGIPFREMLIDWKRYYLEMDFRLDDHYSNFPKNSKFTNKNRRSLVYKNIHFSPDGMKIAYSENDMGKYSVVIFDIATNEEVTAIKGGSRVINQDVNYNLPLMSWVDDNTLGIIDAQNGKITFWLFDVVSKTKTPRVLQSITEVNSLNFNQNGRLGIISAAVNGKSDLYLMSTRRDRLKRLTNDFYDDIDASFVPNTNTVVFSSNRPNDSLNVSGKDFEKISSNFNLFFYNLDTTTTNLVRVTNTLSRDSEPIALSSTEIMYLSDQRGINNLFTYNLNNNIYSQITNFKSSIKEFHYNDETRALAFVASHNSEDHIYFVEGFDKNQQKFTPPSGRQQIIQLKTLQQKREDLLQESQMTVKEIIDSKIQEIEKIESDTLVADTLMVDTLTTNIMEPDTILTDSVTITTDSVTVVQEDDILDTENYVFEKQVSPISNNTNESFLQQYRQVRKKEDINGPYDFEQLFSNNKILTSVLIDPLRGFGMFVESDMTDLLENHNFSGGLMTTTDLRSGDVWAEYNYYKSHIDYKVRFDRKVVFWIKDGDLPPAIEKYSLNKLKLTASYPLDVRSRVSISPFFQRNIYDDLGELDQTGNPLNIPNYKKTVNTDYLGADVEFVFDNSIIPGMNLKDGTRAKLRFSHYQNFSNTKETFSNLRAEVRHYQKIHREIHFATRFFYGSYFGPGAQNYLLGGVDNWIGNKRNTSESNNPLNTEMQGNRSDLLFLEFVSPIRGFNYAELFGTDVMAFNFELRIPLIRYLNSGYIPSNFFRNIQFNAFYDVGSAWTGKSPFNPENTISTITLPTEGAFEITLDNYRNPWLMSYGFGFRTMIMGYYAKFDLAWPILDYKRSDPRLSVSIGFDF